MVIQANDIKTLNIIVTKLEQGMKEYGKNKSYKTQGHWETWKLWKKKAICNGLKSTYVWVMC